MGLLESAVARQYVGARGYLKYPGAFQNAASLMFGICNNHPFHNGNKRTALVAALIHLDGNNLVLHRATQASLYDLMLRIATHTVSGNRRNGMGKGVRPTADDETKAIARWLEDNARKILRGERSITFGQLYRILVRFGFVMGEKRHNKVEILKLKTTIFGGSKLVCVYKASCPGDSRIVALDEIKTLREILNLREEDGVDSKSFYDTQTVIDSFVQAHHSLLRRLAKA